MEGNELRTKIVERRFQLQEIADALGISPQNLSCKLGRHDVSSSLIEGVAKAMSVPVSYLYGETTQPAGNYANNSFNGTQNTQGSTAELAKVVVDQSKQIDRLLGIIASMAGTTPTTCE